MKKIFTFFLIIISITSFGQKEYFQQEVNYEIHATLYPQANRLKAHETIEYINNSPDTLLYIYFHLWPNGYSSKHTALAKQLINAGKPDLYFHNKKYRGWIDSLDFKTDGIDLKWEYDKKHIDICKVHLNEPLYPGHKVTITTPFEVSFPGDISRMGLSDSAFQVTQWYPKPAVYDKYGWHAFPYLDQGEFYSEYGSFDVYLTVPKQFVVAATGNLHNEEELKWLDQLAETKLTGLDLKNPSKDKLKTLHYFQDSIHDFAWFCSKNYTVSIDSVFTSRTDHKVTTWVFYRPGKAFSWSKATDYVDSGVLNYSRWVGDYPYNNCTAVDGALSAGGGMEYPMITVISVNNGIEETIVHEVGHNWFYGMLGFNERDHPFLDEGINTFYDHRYEYEVKNSYPMMNMSFLKGNKDFPMTKRGQTQSLYTLGAISMDQPLDLTSTKYQKVSYGLIVYEKSAEAYQYLREYLGEETFDSIMQAFFQEWKFKHPYPEDLREFFEKSTDKDIAWFFDGYTKTYGKVDYKLNYRNNKLIIKNKGHFAAPVLVAAYKDGKIDKTMWFDPIEKKEKINFPKTDADYFIIDPEFQTIEYNRYNNFIKTKGIFKKSYKIIPTLSTSLFDYYSRKTTILPLIYYNNISKFQVLGLISNYKLPMRKFSYYIMPIYSFGYGQLTGTMDLSFSHIAYNGFPSVKYNFYIDRYPFLSDIYNYVPTLFRKMKFGTVLNLNNKNNSDTYNKKLSLSLYVIDRTVFYYKDYLSSIGGYPTVLNAKFEMTKKSIFRPTSFALNLDLLGDSYKLWAEFKIKFHYTSLKDGIEIRLFSGSNVPIVGSTGYTDYKYDYFFWSRYAKFQAEDPDKYIPHQFVNDYAGITYFYPTRDYFWTNAINIKTSIPKIPLLKLYYNFASGANFQNGTGLGVFVFEPAYFDAGVMLDIIPDVLAVYLPLYGSNQLMNYNKSLNSNILSHFRFTFRLENYSKITNLLISK